jgi:hypothetical protein
MGTRERQSRCPPRSPRTASAKKPTANRGGASAAVGPIAAWQGEGGDFIPGVGDVDGAAEGLRSVRQVEEIAGASVNGYPRASWVPSSTITADDCGSTCSAVDFTGWLSARNREFRAEELIRTERDRIVIVDPVQLGREQGWNQSP